MTFVVPCAARGAKESVCSGDSEVMFGRCCTADDSGMFINQEMKMRKLVWANP